MKRLVCHRPISPDGDLLLGIAQKVGKKASPCTPLHPPVLTTGGTRQRHTKASLTLRTVCADDASTTARCSAPRRGLKGQFVRQQLFRKSLVSYELNRLNRYLSTLSIFTDLARIEWALQVKDARTSDGAKRIPGSRDMHSTGIKFDVTKLRSPDASIRARG